MDGEPPTLQVGYAVHKAAEPAAAEPAAAEQLLPGAEAPVSPTGTLVGGGKYRVDKAIGKGKFAVVYKAERLSDGETVALKRVSVGQMDERARAKALKEVYGPPPSSSRTQYRAGLGCGGRWLTACWLPIVA